MTRTGNTTVRFVCSTPCDDDCETVCHESHLPFWKREHAPDVCLARLNGVVNA